MDLNDLLSDINNQIKKPFELWFTKRRLYPNSIKIIAKIRKFLKTISGNNLLLLVNDILTTKQKKLYFGKYESSLRHFASLYNTTPQKKRHRVLKPMKLAKFTVPECKALGFKVTHYMWKNSAKSKERNKGGRKNIEKDLEKEINLFMESISRSSSYRFLKKQNTNAYIREKSFTEAYNLFNQSHGETISFSTFYKYVDEKFKKPHNMADLCDYCEVFREVYNELILLCNGYGLIDIVDIDNFDLDELRERFLALRREGTNDFELEIRKIDELKALQYHKDIAVRQKDAYTRMKSDCNIFKDKILIDIDFKQKISLGEGPRQRSQEYYNRPIRGLIGFGIYYLDAGKI